MAQNLKKLLSLDGLLVPQIYRCRINMVYNKTNAYIVPS